MRWHALAALCALLTLAACGAAAPDGLTTPSVSPSAADLGGFKSTLEHPFILTTPGVLRIYEGTHNGEHRREEVEVLREPRLILGIPCTPVRQVISVGGLVTEVTTEWFATDVQGNVWRFGEESIEVEDDMAWRSDDSWIAGENGGRPWLTFAAQPRVGDLYAGYRPEGVDSLHVTSLDRTADVAAGRFEGCMEIVENPDDPADKDIILYAAGMGRVSEDSASGRIELTGIEHR